MRLISAAVFVGTIALPLQAQPRASDVATPEAVVTALYASIVKPIGGYFDWPRMRHLFRPSARMYPNPQQTRGVARELTVDQFVAWIDSGWVNAPKGGPNDHGFAESQVNVKFERFGDIAHAFSTYEKGFMDDKVVRGRGINTIQLIRRDDRWWIVSIAWDEERPGQVVPPEYRGRKP
jgi:hypothetical protein